LGGELVAVKEFFGLEIFDSRLRDFRLVAGAAGFGNVTDGAEVSIGRRAEPASMRSERKVCFGETPVRAGLAEPALGTSALSGDAPRDLMTRLIENPWA
jgi:hypothetical protein